ncbi:DUF1829 domain-containing protein [Paenibacillus sp. MBLB2552]|uniref:DUF1829 domain-containing protein n=1 Tax=Paenibacillus mellifer TaxID=2937794 RepID=A0A9X2BNW0_9BACL|nr:DUF1829 domain-containing protein [Paenibacillus mellifer]MCK8487294.1 DUF1829 domain-containing protein [Paenibacillus mellifer]
MQLLKDQLINTYLGWLKQNITLINDAIEITTPLMDRHNDFLQIYVVPQGDKLKLTDDGYIISDLIQSGCDIHGSKKRKEMLQTILNSYGVTKSDKDELFVEATMDTFPQKKHMLAQAMLTVNDMFLTTRMNIQSIFWEDVENFLIMNDIRYTDNVIFTGKSGFSQKFDFVIPKSKQMGERIIQTINNPSKSKAESVLFAWENIKNTRKSDSSLYAIINDAEKTISSDIISAFKQYDVRTILWSGRRQYINELSA